MGSKRYYIQSVFSQLDAEKRAQDKVSLINVKVDNCNRRLIDRKELVISRIVSAIIHYFIHNTIRFSRENVVKNNEKIDEITLENRAEMISFSPEIDRVNKYLENVVQKKVICNYEVARADHNASIVIQKLFERYYKNPRLLHTGTIHKIFVESLNHPIKEVATSAVLLSDTGVAIANEEIEAQDIIIFDKRRILVRAMTDYIAGMTDGYAMEEYSRLR